MVRFSGRRADVTAILMGVLCVLTLSAGVAADRVKVAVLSDTRETHVIWQNEMVEAFNATHPTIEIEIVPVSGNLITRMQTLLAGGVQLDIGWHDPFIAVQWAKSGLVENLTPFMERDPDHFATVPPVLLDMYRVGGGVYGVPHDSQVSAVFYHVDAFNEAGLATPAPGWTYGDKMEMARRLTRRDANGHALFHGSRIPTGRNWVTTIWAFGGDFLDNWAEPTAFTGLNPATIDGLQYLHDLVAFDAVQERPVHDSMNASGAFSTGTVGMTVTNTLSIGGFHHVTEFQWDVSPLPAGPAGTTPMVNAIGWFMFSSSDVKPEAWEVLKYFTSPEALERRVEITQNMPISLGAMETWLRADTAPSRHLLLEEFGRARSPFSLAADIWNPINRETSLAIWGEKSVIDALETMAQLVNVELAK